MVAVEEELADEELLDVIVTTVVEVENELIVTTGSVTSIVCVDSLCIVETSAVVSAVFVDSKVRILVGADVVTLNTTVPWRGTGVAIKEQADSTTVDEYLDRIVGSGIARCPRSRPCLFWGWVSATALVVKLVAVTTLISVVVGAAVMYDVWISETVVDDEIVTVAVTTLTTVVSGLMVEVEVMVTDDME
jgi:hypothetical protein